MQDPNSALDPPDDLLQGELADPAGPGACDRTEASIAQGSFQAAQRELEAIAAQHPGEPMSRSFAEALASAFGGTLERLRAHRETEDPGTRRGADPSHFQDAEERRAPIALVQPTTANLAPGTTGDEPGRSARASGADAQMMEGLEGAASDRTAVEPRDQPGPAQPTPAQPSRSEPPPLIPASPTVAAPLTDPLGPAMAGQTTWGDRSAPEGEGPDALRLAQGLLARLISESRSPSTGDRAETDRRSSPNVSNAPTLGTAAAPALIDQPSAAALPRVLEEGAAAFVPLGDAPSLAAAGSQAAEWLDLARGSLGSSDWQADIAPSNQLPTPVETTTDLGLVDVTPSLDLGDTGGAPQPFGVMLPTPLLNQPPTYDPGYQPASAVEGSDRLPGEPALDLARTNELLARLIEIVRRGQSSPIAARSWAVVPER